MITEYLTTHAKNALVKAYYFAKDFGHAELTQEHLLYGLAEQKGSLAHELLNKYDFPIDLLKQHLIRKFHQPFINDGIEPLPDDNTITILAKAYRTSQLHKHVYVGTEHVLACLLEKANDSLKNLFRMWNIPLAEIQQNALVILKSTSKFPDLTQTLKQLSEEQTEFEDDKGYPILHQFGEEMTDLTYLAKTTPLIGRQNEIDRIEQILLRRLKNNPLLVGDAGVGKTALVEGLSKRIAEGNSSYLLQGKRVFNLQLSSLVAGTMYRGDFEQRIKELLDEIADNNEIIIFIDEIHTLIGAGSSGNAMDAANILKPALARGQIRCIGATTWDEYQKHLLSDQALMRRFQLIPIKEPSAEETKDILEGLRKDFEKFHKISISKSAIESSVELSDRYLTHTQFPDKAIDLIDEAAAKALAIKKSDPFAQKIEEKKEELNQLERDKQQAITEDKFDTAIKISSVLKEAQSAYEKLLAKTPKKARVTEKHIRDAVATRTGIAPSRIRTALKPFAESLYENLRQEIFGQDQALDKLSKSIQRGHSILKDPKNPLGAFLFLGPSGVGKTATAKQLALEVYGSYDSLIRLDMSEYNDKFTISKLIGAPAGYVGYDQSGILTQSIRKNPLSIVLFDEVEKAHPDIFHLLLQILDEGTLRDGSGNLVDFRHSFIVLTSNLGVNELMHQTGFQTSSNEQDEQIMKSSAKSFFQPELLNRLDDIIVFSPLGNTTKKAIIKKCIQRLDKRLGEILHLNISEQALEHIAAMDFDTNQGARAIEKFVKEKVEIPLSYSLSNHKQGSKLTVELNKDRLEIQ